MSFFKIIVERASLYAIRAAPARADFLGDFVARV